MEHKKPGAKQLKPLNQEIAPEPILKAPPPTPCISLKQRSGSVPDVRVVDAKKEKPCAKGSYYKGLFQTFSCSHKVLPKPLVDFDGKRSTSEHSMASGHVRGGPCVTLLMSPCTSNLLHSVHAICHIQTLVFMRHLDMVKCGWPTFKRAGKAAFNYLTRCRGNEPQKAHKALCMAIYGPLW